MLKKGRSWTSQSIQKCYWFTITKYTVADGGGRKSESNGAHFHLVKGNYNIEAECCTIDNKLSAFPCSIKPSLFLSNMACKTCMRLGKCKTCFQRQTNCCSVNELERI